jgi:hypothetical protein
MDPALNTGDIIRKDDELGEEDGKEEGAADIGALHLWPRISVGAIQDLVVGEKGSAGHDEEIERGEEPGAPFAQSLENFLADHGVGDQAHHGECSEKARR